jgi:hypothetical protein
MRLDATSLVPAPWRGSDVSWKATSGVARTASDDIGDVLGQVAEKKLELIKQMLVLDPYKSFSQESVLRFLSHRGFTKSRSQYDQRSYDQTSTHIS